MHRSGHFSLFSIPALLLTAACTAASEKKPAVVQDAAAFLQPRGNVTIDRNEEKGTLRVLIDHREAIVYRYSKSEDLVHYWPVRSPSGKSMTVQHPQPYPHHRSFWFADKVKLEGKRAVTFYGALYSKKEGQKRNEYPDRIRHEKFLKCEANRGTARITSKLVWEMDFDTPVLDELRTAAITSLGNREYFMDITFAITASYGDVTFVSDWVHYAWPYIRMNKTFNVADGGGTIINSEGGKNQKETNGKPARWIDYSASVEKTAEGLAIFCHPDNASPHKWLTRDYGCFGPRRVDAKSGKRFVLKKGETLKRRIGILVHTGNVKSGKVAERYQAYCRTTTK